MADTSLLAYPQPDAPTNIMTDASNNAVSAVLQQVDNAWLSFQRPSSLERPDTAHSTVNY